MAVAKKDKRKKRPLVVSRHGRFRFQTGMVTASLLNRGLSMSEASEVARAVRDSVAERVEIKAEKLQVRIDEVIAQRLGSGRAEEVRRVTQAEEPVVMIESAHGRFPFSRGVLLRHLDTSGLRLEPAMGVVSEVEQWVRTQGVASLPQRRMHEEVARLLANEHGEGVARRFRLTDWVGRAKRPMVVLIGGATGTGKSTLAMELAYRLGVVWVTSTDLIRETMRTVVSPDLAPGLHDHSFRGMVVGGQVLSDPRERVLVGYRQQAAQVAVGIRAVIRRALRENAHIIVEGTHIAPPFHQYVPEELESEVYVAGFLLAVPDEKTHRKRFPSRARSQLHRAAEPYLDAFQSVRWIHDDLLRMAEESEAVVLPNLSRGKTLQGAVDFLSRELPIDLAPLPKPRVPRGARSPLAVPTLFLILDGLADEPNPALGGRTPLAAAATHYLRRLAASGGQGQISTRLGEHEIPSTDEGLLALLGAGDERKGLGRGYMEALGQGVPIPTGAVLLRGNLSTVEPNGSIVDRRAGRIRAGVHDLLASLRDVPLPGGIIGRLYPGHEHRILVMLVGSGLSAAVSDTDPGEAAPVQRTLDPRPLDDSPEAARSADALRELLVVAGRRLAEHPLNVERLSQGLPPVNAIVTRGAAQAPDRRPLDVPLGAMVASCNTALGVGRYIGLQLATNQRMTGNLDTELGEKFAAAGQLLEDHDFVVVHVKGTDIAAHDRRPLEKRNFISAVDAALGAFLEGDPGYSGHLRVVVSADHGTSSITGNHLPDPVPLLLATWRADSEDEAEFDEESSAHGALGELRCGELGEMLGLRGPESRNTALPRAANRSAFESSPPPPGEGEDSKD